MATSWWDLLLSGLGGVAAFIGIAGALVRALIWVWRAADLGSGLFARGRLKTLMEMRADASGSNGLTAYLDGELELEKFRVASGVSTDHQRMAALIRLFRLGFWERGEICRAAKYLKVSPLWQHPRFEIDRNDEVEALSSLVLGVALPMSGALVWAALVVKMPIYGFLLGALAFLASALAATWIGKPYGDLRSARRIKAYVESHPHILQPVGRVAAKVKNAA